MDIKLNVGSDKPFKLNGLDAELARLKEFQGILTDLGVPKAAKIDIQVTGADNLLRARSHVEQIISLLKQAGDVDLGEKLKANMMGPEAVFASVSAKAAEMNAKLREMRQTFHANNEEFTRATKDDTYGGKTGGLGKSISHDRAIRFAKEYRDALSKAEQDIVSFEAKTTAAESAALLAKSLIGLNAAAAASASPMQAATTQTEAHAKAAAHDAAETSKAAAAQEALNRAKEKSKKATGEGVEDGNVAKEVRDAREMLAVRRSDIRHREKEKADRERTDSDFAEAQRKTAEQEQKQEKADIAKEVAQSRATLATQRSMRRHDEKKAKQEHRAIRTSDGVSADMDALVSGAMHRSNQSAEKSAASEAGRIAAEKAENDKILSAAMAENGRLRRQRQHKERVDAERADRARRGSDGVSADMDALVWGAMHRSNQSAEKSAASEAGRIAAEKAENDKMLSAAMAEDGRLRRQRQHKERVDAERAERARRAQEAEGGQPGILGGYGQKLGAVAMYTAAASTVYAGLHAVKSGVSGAVSTDRQQAVLQAVFRGNPDEAKKLTLDTLALAQANGRDTEEAMKAAVAWGRLGHSRSETGRLIEISMRAANVAEISTEESAKNLAAIYSSFRMDVGGVSSALDQMNSTSNRSNVAVKDLMSGVARAGAVARAAGMDFATLNSLVGVGVAGTGRPGAEFGNAIKSMLVTMADPAKQAVLKSQYGIDAFKADGTAKTGNEFVRELARRSQGMDQDQKMDMLRVVGGKQQASRLAVMLDKYGEAQSMAIESMGDLNASQKESLLILDTTEAKLKGLSAAWTGMWHSAFQGSKGNINGMLTGVANAMPAVGNFMGRAGAVVDDVLGGKGWNAVDAFDRNSETGRMLAAFNREGEKKQSAIKDIVQRKAKAEMQAESLRDTAEHFGTTNDRAADLKGIKQMARDAAANDPSRRKDLEKHWTELYESDGPDAVRAEVIGEVDSAKGRAKDAGEQTRAAMSGMAAFLENKQAYLETKRAEAQAAIDALIEKERARRKKRDDAQDADRARNPNYRGSKAEAEHKSARLSRPSLETFVPTADRDTLAQIEAQIKDYKERAEDNRGKMTYLTDPDDDTLDMAKDRAQQRRRDMAPLLFGAIGQWSGGLPMGSDREVDKLARERGILAQQRAFMGSPESHGISAGKREAMMLQIAERGNELEAKGPGAQAHDTVMRGVRTGKNDIAGFGAGLNQTERLMDSIRGIQVMVPDITAQKARGGDDALLASGRALTLNVALTQRQEALDTRRAALAHEIAQAKMEENKHAAEGLAFASRSDQLTAAIFQRRLLTKGQMTPAEAIMYSPDTLRAIKERVPGALPFGARAEKEREMARIGPAIEDAKARAAAIRPALDAAQTLPAIQFPQVLQGATVPVTIVNGVVQTHEERTQKTAQPGADNPQAVVATVPAQAVVVPTVPAQPAVVPTVPAQAVVVPPVDKFPAPRKTVEEEKQAKRDAIIQAAKDQMDATTGPKPAFDFNKNSEDIRGTYDTWFPKSAKTKRDNLRRLRDEETKKLFDQYPGDSKVPYFEGASSLDYAVERENRERDQRAWDKKISISGESNKKTADVPKPAFTIKQLEDYGLDVEALDKVIGKKPSALEALLSKEPGADIEAERKIGASRLNPSELPGFRETFTEVQKFMGEMYGKDASQFGMPELAAYGKRGQAYNVDGNYNFETNSLSLSRDSMERFSKGDPDAKNTVRHELTHYFQDKMAGDVKSLDKLRGTGIEDVNKKLRGMGLTPEKGGSSEHQKGYEAQAYEEMAEMAAGYFERKTSGSTGPKSGSGGNTLQRFRGPGVDAAQALPPIQFPAMNVNVDAGAQVGELWNKAQQFMENVVNSRFQAMTERMEAFAHAVGGGVLQGAGSDTILGAD